MDNQIFVFISGLAMIILGLLYLLSMSFARQFFYAPNVFGGRNLLLKLIPERLGISIIRFIIGPGLIVAGALLIIKIVT